MTWAETRLSIEMPLLPGQCEEGSSDFHIPCHPDFVKYGESLGILLDISHFMLLREKKAWGVQVFPPFFGFRSPPGPVKAAEGRAVTQIRVSARLGWSQLPFLSAQLTTPINKLRISTTMHRSQGRPPLQSYATCLEGVLGPRSEEPTSRSLLTTRASCGTPAFHFASPWCSPDLFLD